MESLDTLVLSMMLVVLLDRLLLAREMELLLIR